MTRILLTGASGMLGHDLFEVLQDYDLDATTRTELDVTSWDEVREAVPGHDVVINAAAYTAVDDAETHRDLAFAINAEGPRLLARAAKQSGATLIHVSTDYVFNGQATTAYPESTPLDPQSAYGESKAAGEHAIQEEHPDGSVIIRTAWLYGTHGSHFPGTMLKAAQTRDTLDVVTDQIGQPTWSRDLAQMIRVLVEAKISRGIFHGTNAGHTSWYGFAREIFATAGLDPERIQPTTSDAFVRPATRPAWSVLGHQAWSDAGLPTPRAWEEAWREAFPVCCARYLP